MPSFTSNDVTYIFYNKKLDFPLIFSISNLVVMVVLLVIALIQIIVNFRDTCLEIQLVVNANTIRENTKGLGNRSVEAIYH